MSLLTKKAFAELAGESTSYLSKYISRGKITMTGDLINTEDPNNIIFLSKRVDKNKTATNLDEHFETKECDYDLFLKELEDEFLGKLEYLPAKEKDLVELNKTLIEGNQLIPRMILDNMANGSLIELCASLYKRELELRSKHGLSTNDIKKYYVKLCKTKIKELEQGINEIMEDITNDNT
jgi:hypothetical protein